ncbi:MAG: hypothetical protein ABEK50_05635 [bacterium]
MASLLLIVNNTAVPGASGNIGFQYSYVQYTEPDIEMSGALPGFKGDVKVLETDPVSLTIRGRVSSGELTYDGQTLETDPKPVKSTSDDFLSNLEMYLVLDRELVEGRASPFLGIGHRKWDNRLQDSNNVAGFLREVEYLYLPIGLRYPYGEGDHWSGEFNLSYRFFVEGSVTSHLSEVRSDFPDVTNTQDRGDGVMVGYQYHRSAPHGGDYNLEAFLKIWDVSRSDLVATNADIDGDGSDDAVFEPRNETLELGGRLTVAF